MSSLLQGLAVSGRELMNQVTDPDTTLPEGYFRGLAVDSMGALYYSLNDTANPVYVAGLRVSPRGVLIVDDNVSNFDHYGPGAAPQSAGDALIVELISAPDNYYQGVPYSGDAIAVDNTGAFTAFNNGFSDGFG